MNYSKEEIKIIKKFYPQLGQKTLPFLQQIKEPTREWTLNCLDHATRALEVKYGIFEDGEEVFLDIETTNLNADFAYMISYAMKVRGEDKVYSGVISKEEIFSGNFDKRLVSECVENLSKFKRIYTYYGTKFDLPFLRSRAVYHKIDFIPYGLIQHQDIYYLIRNKFRFSRNRLEGVTEFLGIEGKTKLSGNIWVRATIGDKESLDYILKHNIADVAILEKLYERVRTFASVSRTSI
jgi:uncharacterized protein YprB with RNaseH-like and TPR domain